MSPPSDSEAIAAIKTSVAVIQTDITNIMHSVAVLNQVLIGNGDVKHSMVVRVERLEGSITHYNKTRRSFWARCQWLITSAIAIAAIIMLILKG